MQEKLVTSAKEKKKLQDMRRQGDEELDDAYSLREEASRAQQQQQQRGRSPSRAPTREAPVSSSRGQSHAPPKKGDCPKLTPNCGLEHGSKPKDCFAHDKKCNYQPCGKKGHFEHMCRKKKADEKEGKTGGLGPPPPLLQTEPVRPVSHQSRGVRLLCTGAWGVCWGG
uniref:Uncharacterized protein n=1 Tax=Chromera velia CCMP2878 TaxID=1169474 RepID=A0A0G4G3K9_9ALVE|eukprot:Cvel_4120.t1-p1 / transcript=Cvel_4120.t1 / gene=Cvel_4120 / organism=Chromera_velia_CCMP2878 / gene_product=hypothetical protein / transcript_product=hypothetical protein / location=Cvel_scaffold176:22937-24612(+) / protein_length=167 / sequence_SO=supercontig / SO=protein_coding / is_pseudo=false